jgi:tripartite-type tricarboxylate transporter receptor subunit TctC
MLHLFPLCPNNEDSSRSSCPTIGSIKTATLQSSPKLQISITDKKLSPIALRHQSHHFTALLSKQLLTTRTQTAATTSSTAAGNIRSLSSPTSHQDSNSSHTVNTTKTQGSHFRRRIIRTMYHPNLDGEQSRRGHCGIR